MYAAFSRRCIHVQLMVSFTQVSMVRSAWSGMHYIGIPHSPDLQTRQAIHARSVTSYLPPAIYQNIHDASSCSIYALHCQLPWEPEPCSTVLQITEVALLSLSSPELA